MKSTSSDGFLLLHLGANLADDFVDSAAAFVLELYRDVSGVRLGDCRKPQLQARAPRGVFHFGNGANDLLDVS